MKRIQRKRTMGWRMPENTIYVGRPTKWGNPWSVTDAESSGLFEIDECRAVVVSEFESWLRCGVDSQYYNPPIRATEFGRKWILEHIHELVGHDIACWCPLDKPCHADVLMELVHELEVKQ